MIVTEDISEFGFSLEIIASPKFFKVQGAIDWGYFVENGSVLPFYIKKKYFFRYMLFTTGILGSIPTNEKGFLNNVVDYIKQNFDIDFIGLDHVTALFNSYPDNAKACLFGSYIIDLSQKEEDIIANMHPKHRNVIKKAIKEEVQISCDIENKSECIKLIRDTLIRQGIPAFKEELFHSFSNNLGKNIDFWLAKHLNEPHGAAIILWSDCGTAYYMFGGSCEHPNGGAMNLLHWEAIKKMQERKVRFYDFVGARIEPNKGSKYEGIQRFKSRFGGELKTAYIWKITFNSFKYSIFELLLRIKSRGKYKGDIIDQERIRGKF